MKSPPREGTTLTQRISKLSKGLAYQFSIYAREGVYIVAPDFSLAGADFRVKPYDSKKSYKVFQPIKQTREVIKCLYIRGQQYTNTWPLRLVSEFLSYFIVVDNVFQGFKIPIRVYKCSISIVKPLVVLREVPIYRAYHQEVIQNRA